VAAPGAEMPLPAGGETVEVVEEGLAHFRQPPRPRAAPRPRELLRPQAAPRGIAPKSYCVASFLWPQIISFIIKSGPYPYNSRNRR